MSPNAHGFDDFFGITSGYCDFYSHRTQFGELRHAGHQFVEAVAEFADGGVAAISKKYFQEDVTCK